MTVKRGSIRPTKPRESSQAQPKRVHEVATEKRSPTRHVPYESKKHQTKARAKRDLPYRHKFKISLKELIAIPDVADKLKFPPKGDNNLGLSKGTWCEFHKAFEHSLRNCLALGHQLADLVKDGFLKEYLEEGPEASATVTPATDQGHEFPIHGEVNTISRGFSMGGCTASQRKKYASEVMAVDAREPDQSPEPALYFTKADLQDVVPHNDPVVISMVTVGRRVC